jgi:hypothetical protein
MLSNHNEWREGDTVEFTLQGKIAHVVGGIATIDVRGIPYTIHVSHIIGTPEQAKRARILAMLNQEFSAFHLRFEPMPNSESGWIWSIERRYTKRMARAH